jgi:hypothetical protein
VEKIEKYFNKLARTKTYKPNKRNLNIMDIQSRTTANEVLHLWDVIFDNKNVYEKQENRLHAWNMLFKRVLQRDGKRMLYLHRNLRFNVKQRAHDALAYPAHPVYETAQLVMEFMTQVEYWGMDLADFDPKEQV